MSRVMINDTPEKTAREGFQIVMAAKAMFLAAGVVLVFAVAISMGLWSDTGLKLQPAWGGFIFSGICFGAAFLFYLLGQVVLIRAEIQRR